jgi:N-acyl-L-homoserine lactone synthetase
MTGNLDDAITTLLTAALPHLFSGATPPVALTIQSDRFVVDPNSAEGMTSEPRADDQHDHFAFNPAGIVFDPNDPNYDPLRLPTFTLTKPPYPGPRRIRLRTAAGDRIPVREREVRWDEMDARILTLALSPTRDLTDANGVEVLYSMIAVFTTLKAHQTMTLQLQAANAAQLEQAEALVVGVVELNKQELIEHSVATYDEGDYRATVKANSLTLIEGNSPAGNQRVLAYQIEIELKTTRALRSDEGRPIVHIRTPGRPLDPDRLVDIDIGTDA